MNPIIVVLGLVIAGIGLKWDKVESNKKGLTNSAEPETLPIADPAITVPTLVDTVPTSAIEDTPK